MDKHYIMALQKPENGRTWDFIAGPYDSSETANANKDYAAQEYSARNNNLEWLAGADIRVVHSDMPLTTALGAIQAKEFEPLAKALAEETHQDEHAARVRDYGEADAASYEQRVREGVAAIPEPKAAPEGMTTEELDRYFERFGPETAKANNAIFADMMRDVSNPPRFEQGSSPEATQESITYRIWQAHDASAAAAGWSAFPADYQPAIDVEAESLKDAYDTTSWGAWWEMDEVKLIAQRPRSTAIGDVITTPDGYAHRVKPEGFDFIDPATEKAKADEPSLERVERQLRDWKHNHSTEFRPDHATGRIGPGTHRWENDAWAVMAEADKLRVMEGELNWGAIGDINDHAKEALLAREVDFSKISREQLNSMYEEVFISTPHAPDERPARRLFDNANYDLAKKDRAPFDEQLAKVRPVTRNLIESVMQDGWPRAAAIVDFGIDSQKNYESLYYPIRNEEIAPAVLDAAMGHGAKLTELVRGAPSNPHKDIEFHTSWDELLGREKPEIKDSDVERSDYERQLLDAVNTRKSQSREKSKGPDR